MSEARFDRIEEGLDRSDERLDRMEQWQGRADERFDRVEQRLDRLETGQTGLRSHMDSRFDEFGRYMRVLYEDLVDRIAAMRESPPATTAQTAEAISRRLDPLEAMVPVVREHEVTLRRHDAEIDRLERRRR